MKIRTYKRLIVLTLVMLCTLLPALQITARAETDDTAPQLLNGTSKRTQDTEGKITFETTEGGTYYVAVSTSNTIANVDTLKTNANYGPGKTGVCEAGTVTVKLDTLQSQQTNYCHVIVIDAAENISNVLTILIDDDPVVVDGTLYLKGGVLYTDVSCASSYELDKDVIKGWSTGTDGALVLENFEYNAKATTALKVMDGENATTVIRLLGPTNFLRIEHMANQTTNMTTLSATAPGSTLVFDNGGTSENSGTVTGGFMATQRYSNTIEGDTQYTVCSIDCNNLIVQNGATLEVNVDARAAYKKGIAFAGKMDVVDGATVYTIVGYNNASETRYGISGPTLTLEDAVLVTDASGIDLNVANFYMKATSKSTTASPTKLQATGYGIPEDAKVFAENTALYLTPVNTNYKYMTSLEYGIWYTDKSFTLAKNAMNMTIEMWYLVPTINVAAQSSTLIYGESGSAQFDVTPTYFATPPTSYTLVWYTDEEGTTMTTAPAGLSATTNTSVVTLSGSTIPVGTYYFRVTSGAVQSDLCTLTVNKATHTGLQTAKTIIVGSDEGTGNTTVTLAGLLDQENAPEGMTISAVSGPSGDEIMNSVTMMDGKIAYQAKGLTPADHGKQAVYQLTLTTPNYEDVNFTLTFEVDTQLRFQGTLSYDPEKACFVSDNPADSAMVAALNGYRAADHSALDGESKLWRGNGQNLYFRNLHLETAAATGFLVDKIIILSMIDSNSITATGEGGQAVLVNQGMMLQLDDAGTLVLAGMDAGIAGAHNVHEVSAFAKNGDMLTYSDTTGYYMAGGEKSKQLTLQCNNFGLELKAINGVFGLYVQGTDTPYVGRENFSVKMVTVDGGSIPQLTLDEFKFGTVGKDALTITAESARIDCKATMVNTNGGSLTLKATGDLTITGTDFTIDAIANKGFEVAGKLDVQANYLQATGALGYTAGSFVTADHTLREGGQTEDTGVVYADGAFTKGEGELVSTLRIYGKPIYTRETELTLGASIEYDSAATKTLELEELLDAYAELANPQVTLKSKTTENILAEATLDDGTLSYTLKTLAADDVDKTDSIVLHITSGNYRSFDYTLTLLATEKTVVTISGVTIPGAKLDDTGATLRFEKTYDNQETAYDLSNLSITNLKPGEDLDADDLIYTWQQEVDTDEGKKLVPLPMDVTAPKNAGTYLLEIAVPAENEIYTGTLLCHLDIIPRAIILKPVDTTITVGTPLPDIHLEFLGLLEDDMLGYISNADPIRVYAFVQGDGTPLVDTKTAGTYELRWTGDTELTGHDAENYVIDQKTGILTIEKKKNNNNGSTGTTTQPSTVLGDTMITGSNTKVTENQDGSVTLPNGGSVQVNETVEAKVPSGTTVATDGTVTIPENKTATVDLMDVNQELTIPGGSTIAPDGTVMVGIGSTQVDLGNGAKLTANEGTRVTPAGAVTVGKAPAEVKLPGGTNVTLTEGSQVDGKQIVVGKGGATVQGNDGQTYTFAEGEVLVFDESVPMGFFVAYKNPFTDVAADDWFAEAVQFAQENGLMQGMGEGSFAPNELLNRGMMVQILYNLAKNPATQPVNFGDVVSDAWYADAVGWAASLGIVLGVDENQFAPKQNITREQMATMLYRFCQKMEIKLPIVRTGEFADGADISDYAAEAVNALYNAGILNGKGADAFDPQGNATRAEIAQLLMNFLQAVQ